MDLTKKTTILLSPDMHERLASLAAERKTSMGQLVREACERQYGDLSVTDRLAVVQRLGALNLPTGSVEQMERESVPDPEDRVP